MLQLQEAERVASVTAIRERERERERETKINFTKSTFFSDRFLLLHLLVDHHHHLNCHLITGAFCDLGILHLHDIIIDVHAT